MNSFSINRFGKTLRWVVSVNFRKLLMWTIGAALVVFLGEMILFNVGPHHVPDAPKQLIQLFSVLCTLLLVIASFVLISSIVSGINEKHKREAFLMLPSSNLEKYLSLVAYTAVISIACLFLAIVVGDSLRMLWVWASGYPNEIMGTTVSTRDKGIVYNWYSSVIPHVLHNLTPHIRPNGYIHTSVDGKLKIVYMCTNAYLIARHVMIVAFYVWVHSLFTFCGTLLRKYAFVVSGIVVIFVAWLNGWAEHIGFGLYDHQTYVQYGREGFQQFETVVSMVNSSIASVVLLLLTSLSIFNYWASFHIFKGFQLITNKWTNYDILKR